MKLFDSHCHLDFSAFDDDRRTVVQRAQQHHVAAIFVPGVSRRQSLHTQWLTDCTDTEIIRGFGLHPYFIEQHTPDDLDWLEQQLQLHPKACVGEVGLDATCSNYELQYRLFCQQVELASTYQRPLVLHHRKTQSELLRVIKQQRHCLPEHAGVIHAFSGSTEQANAWIALGFMLGVGGTITYQRAQKTRAAIRQANVHHLVIETDAPDMPLAGYQGRRNEPMRIAEVLQHLSELRDESRTLLATQTWNNAKRLFHVG